MRGTKPSTVRQDDAALAKVPPAPAWLSKAGKAEWRRIMPALIERRIITVADLGSVENYCAAQARVHELAAQIAAAGDIDLKLHRAQMQAMQTARQLAAELGLTPVSRSRPAVRADSNADDDDNPLSV